MGAEDGEIVDVDEGTAVVRAVPEVLAEKGPFVVV